MRKYSFRRTPPHYLILSVALACTPVAAQTAIPSPLLVLQDSANDTATLPLLEVIGGSQSKTQGAEITSQSQSTTGSVLPPLSTIMPQGYGGLSLVQTGGFTAPNTGAGGQDSPVFAMCAQQLIDSTDTSYACWDWQVLGGGTTVNPSDLLTLTRVTQTTAKDITLQVPDALNIATGSIDSVGAHHGGQLTIGALPSADTNLSLKYITVVGGYTSSNATNAEGNPLQLFPGWLSVPITSGTSIVQEGALQIGMTVISSSANNFLACYSSTAQTATTCGNTTAPLLGVYSPLGCATPTSGSCSTGGSAAVVAPPSRAVVASTDANPWTAGTPVCRDPMAPSEAITESGAPCQIGQAVGVAVGDYCARGTCTSHLVDLDFAPQGTTSSGNATAYATAASSLHGAASGNILVADGTGNVSDSGISDGFTTTPYLPQVIGAININSQGASIAPTNIVSTPATGVYNVGGALYAWTKGISCSGTPPQVTVTISWTQDDSTSASESFTSNALPISNSIPANQVSVNLMISALAGTNIKYSTTFSGGTCTTQPTYALRLRVVRE